MSWTESIRKHGLSRLAREVGVKPQAVFYWVTAERMPADRAVAVHDATGIPLHEMRPDLWTPPSQDAA